MKVLFLNNYVKHIFFIVIFATSFSGQSDHLNRKYNQVEKKAIKLEKRILKVEQRVDALTLKIDSIGFLIK